MDPNDQQYAGQQQYMEGAPPQGGYDGQAYDGQQYDDQQYDGQQYDGQQYDGQQYEGQQYDGQQYDGQGYEQGYGGEQYAGEGGYDPNQPGFDGEYSESIPDILYLNHYCAHAFPPQDDSEEARMAADASWEPVRDWMRTHSAEEVRAAAEQRDDAGKTALHFACQNVPPPDVIDVFLSIAVDIVQWPDSFTWLPIHYACAYGADTRVIKSLAEAYPESKTTVDRKGRTPLHFALGTSNSNSPAVVVLLSSTGAASFADNDGLLPLHYACAYGASEESLYVLTDAHHDAITTMDGRGRTPLHFALSNAGNKAAPAAVRLLLSLKKDLVNSVGGGPLPLRVLSEFASTLKKIDTVERDSVQTCLKHLLLADPDPTADFFTALQSLPDFLQERAVVMRVVQELLNEKIAQRFPTLILMLDFFVQIMVVLCYSLAVKQSVDNRFEPESNDTPDSIYLAALYLGATYFLVREIVQVLSLIALKAWHIWVYDPSNWLNIAYIFLIYTWTILMTSGGGNKERFRTCTAISILVIWTRFLAYLRNMLIDFAVFTGGVFHVMRRLVAFLICLIVILIAFSRMFYTLFHESDFCIYENEGGQNPFYSGTNLTDALRCDEYELRPWCDNWDSFLAVYTMLLGEVDETAFNDDKFAVILFAIFMFLCVILLANVLIAIVTDSYKVIQDERAAIVFWTNRLDFIAQMDAIANGPWKQRLRAAIGLDGNTRHRADVDATFGKDFWKRLMDLFEDDLDENIFSIEFLIYMFLRILTVFFVIPAWVLLGICSAGWLWPPQIREFVFTSTVSKHNSESEKEDELRRTQILKLQSEIVVLKEEILQDLALDRTQVVQLKSAVAERKLEIQNEMKHIKRIVTMLFEQQGSM